MADRRYDPIGWLLEERYLAPALAVSIHRYRESPGDADATLIRHLRATATRTNWCSPVVGIDHDCTALAVDPSGSTIVAGGFVSYSQLLFRDVASGAVEVVDVDLGEGGGACALAFSPDGSQILVLTTNGRELYLVDAKSRANRRLGETPWDVYEQYECSFSPSGRRVAIAYLGGVALVADVENLEFHEIPGRFVGFDRGRVLCEGEQACFEYDLDDPMALLRTTPVLPVCARRRDRRSYRDNWVACDRDTTGHGRFGVVRDLTTAEERTFDFTEFRPGGTSGPVAMSPSGEWFLVDAFTDFHAIHVETGTRIAFEVPLPSQALVTFIDSDRFCLAGVGCRAPRIFSLRAQGELHPMPCHLTEVESVEFSPDGSRVVSRDDDRSERTWSLGTGELERVSWDPIEPRAWFEARQGDPEGLTWRLEAESSLLGLEIAEPRLHVRTDGAWQSVDLAGKAYGFCRPPGSSYVYISCVPEPDNPSVQAVRLDDLAVLPPIELGRPVAGPIAVHERTDRLAIARGYGAMVCLFHLRTGALLERLSVEVDIECLAFSPCGSFIACGTESGAVITWKIGDPESFSRSMEPTAEPIPPGDLERWLRDTGVGIDQGEIVSVERPGSSYAKTEWARHCIECYPVVGHVIFESRTLSSRSSGRARTSPPAEKHLLDLPSMPQHVDDRVLEHRLEVERLPPRCPDAAVEDDLGIHREVRVIGR